MENKNYRCNDASQLSSFFHSSTQDIEQHVSAFKDWKLHFLQMTEGPFEGEIVYFELEGLKVIKDRISQSVLKKGALENATISFSIPLSRPASPLICQGKTYHYPGVLAVRGGELPEIRVPAGLDLLCLSMDAHYLMGLLDGPNADIDRSLAEPCYIPASAGYRKLAESFELACHSRIAYDYPAVRHELRDALLGQMLDLLERGEVEKITASARKRVVDRARDVIAANEGDSLTILSLCHAIGVSRRKLQYCFQDCLGVSPVTYIRLFRLNEVHKSLLNGGGATHVQDEAARRGFYHLGRFSVEYRRLFGEKPSQTLQRSQRNRADSG
ncbi:helix-turn-helix domain-containing protein [Modicisalibacter radicis]|uniref:helix-turn-helix domain-containing protein n=1 Tax=Halomonas sp. EAR18 TaxID=2518972 RepID=UPI001443F1B3|nr:helix-turn-helix domain-containing protein [Halomonas sp. EAR18]